MTYTENEIGSVAREVITKLPVGNRATVLALSGDLGAGKTTLTKALASEFGVTETVISPTFVLIKFYKLEGQKWDNLIHIDAYRIEDEKELEPLNWNEIISSPKNLVIIEWPEKIIGQIPKNAVNIAISHENFNKRSITLS